MGLNKERQVMAWIPWDLANEFDDYISKRQREERENGQQTSTKKSILTEAIRFFLSSKTYTPFLGYNFLEAALIVHLRC